MAKYGLYSRRPPPNKRPWEVHPIWRGIGCILLILVPILSFTGAVVLVQENQDQRWVAVPAELARPVTLPLWGAVDNFYAITILAVLLILAAFVLLTALYALVYRLAGPPPYGPMDAPPVRGKPGRR